MNNNIIFLSIGIAILAVALSTVSFYMFYEKSLQVSLLEEEIELIKNQISGNTNSRGEMTQQSISKMTSNIVSMTNENSENTVEKRLDIIEEDISKLKSSVKTP